MNIADLAIRALYKELYLTPKPGLVDKHDSGSHLDMDLDLLIKSIKAIEPWFYSFYTLGKQYFSEPHEHALKRIRTLGIECEKSMFKVTNNINTHKGGIFSLGLLCFAAGRLSGKGGSIESKRLCDEVSKICKSIIKDDFKNNSLSKLSTVGEKIFYKYGFLGARGEAASGFKTIQDYSLPIFQKLISKGFCEDDCLLISLLVLMAKNTDTNIISRGGIEGMKYVQNYAFELCTSLGIIFNDSSVDLQPSIKNTQIDKKAIIVMNNDLIAKNLSPGGSADLLSTTWVLSKCL